MFKKKLFVISIKSKLNDLFFIPFLLIVFNNMIFLLFKQKEVGFTYDFTFILQIILTITVSISEELLFRVYVHSILNINNKILKIIISSLIFGLFHIVYFLSSFDPYDLIIITYTFGLGLVLGFVYEFSENNFIYIMIIHFLFNFLNKDLFLRLFNGTNDYIFYIVSIIVSLITLIYGLLIYFMYFKNKKINN
ncbi:MAG: CPBP family intramembrane metalloprotease [Bacilli bacterium]|nr:CPBP family intramembrane metalloprotease [Bacilli bacterium]